MPAEDCIPAQQTGEEAVVPAFLSGACGVDASENEHGGFVDHGEGGEVPGVLACGFEDELELFPESMSSSSVARNLRGTDQSSSTYVPDRKRNIML